MAQIINTNVLSLNAQRNLTNSQSALQTSLQRLSSGLRINSAKDDAAGLAISERFTTQIRGLNQAVRNANDGISFAQTAEGALSTVGDALQRIRELAVQSANDTNSSSDRQALNNEVQQLIAEVNRVANATEFNGQKILDGSLSELVFQVGANQNQTITVNGVDARASQLGARVAEGDSALSGDFTGAFDFGTPGTLAIQGVEIDLADLNTDATSLTEVVNRINALSAETGVTAALSSQAEATFAITAADAAGTLNINGVNIAVDSGDTAELLAGKINALSNQTGVTASFDGADLTLTSNGDITIERTGGGALVIGGLGAGESGTIMRGIDLATNVGQDILVATTGSADDLNITAGGTDRALTDQNVLSRERANQTIQVMDFALQQVSGLRAELGAVQVRFESTISNLGVSVENLSAARSRIRDADFAAETAELTRAQILQQAGISVLAQANAVPQSVLALLQ
ncbi:flagellin domain-containing protein [Thioalkalivibrio sulfidiphilus HL-EbGr7]|uniref:Flagellin n=1 Tax=Thioalkalivibrio sulfidiphilus (strain HL-EbGR7) TaxID=396588 RepID=B8GT47_THISH|nr:flagellin [Thioalkalivibrio sulfidiphilus]ACL73062.1 flagellin domain-containing protein [Thioalkalivibrio sulfidiphilus HL-EbGr7]